MLNDKTLRFYTRAVLHDPLSLPAIIWKRCREAVLPAPKGHAQTRFHAVALDVDLSLHKLVKKYYFQTHEMFLAPVFETYVQPGSIFIDIGANCGYWSAFGLDRVGPSGAVHAFEPVPQFFSFVQKLAILNPSYQMHANNAACGAKSGQLNMAVVLPDHANFENFDTNIGSSSLLPGFLDHEKRLITNIDVPVIKIDDYLTQHAVDLDKIGLIKIDVEGFESFVLDGMECLLAKPGKKIPLLIEVLTDTQRHPLMDGALTVRRLESYGYRCLDAVSRAPVQPKKFGFEENILCI